MKKIYLIILLFLFLLGCEEIIEVDLNSANPQIVIEANVTGEGSFVKLSKSNDFYDRGTTLVLNAEADLEINNLNNIVFYEYLPGTLKNDVTVSPNYSYTIVVTVEGKKYQSTSVAPNPITIDSLSYKLESRPVNKDKKFLELHVHFKDNPDEKNYIRFKVSKNGEILTGIFLYDDRLSNGNEIDFFFFNFNDEEFQKNDNIEVELLNIDEPVFTYFKTLRKAQANTSAGPFGSQAPANPISNWSNGALGYFSAFIVDKKSIILE